MAVAVETVMAEVDTITATETMVMVVDKASTMTKEGMVNQRREEM